MGWEIFVGFPSERAVGGISSEGGSVNNPSSFPRHTAARRKVLRQRRLQTAVARAVGPLLVNPAPAAEFLEPRVMLTFAPTLSGPGPIVEGTPYNFTLDWTGTATVSKVVFNWGGDGTLATTVSGAISDPYVIPHTYATTGRFTPNAQVTPSSGSTVTIPLSLDSNFGGPQPGTAVTNVTTGVDAAYATIIQPNSDVVVAGVSNGNNFELARYAPNGSLDTTFGTGGKVDINFGGGAAGRRTRRMAWPSTPAVTS
jgi:hypothetical protein